MEECDVAKEYLESDRANAIDETTVGACTHLEVLITVINATSFSVFIMIFDLFSNSYDMLTLFRPAKSKVTFKNAVITCRRRFGLICKH